MKTRFCCMLAGLVAFAQMDDKSTEHKSYAGVHELVIDNVTRRY